MLPAVSSSSRLTRGARVRLRTLVLSSALVAAGIQPVAAQTVDDDDASMATQQLNLPQPQRLTPPMLRQRECPT